MKTMEDQDVCMAVSEDLCATYPGYPWLVGCDHDAGTVAIDLAVEKPPAFRNFGYMLHLSSIMGPGGAVRIDGQGNVYKLARVDDFFGRYTQHSGSAGLAQDGTGELWLQNDSGVVMHLTSQVRGMILSLGRQEIVILRP